MLLGATFAFPRPSAAASSDLYPRLGCAAGEPSPPPSSSAAPHRHPPRRRSSPPSAPRRFRVQRQVLVQRFDTSRNGSRRRSSRRWRRFCSRGRAPRGIARDALARAERSELGLENAAKELKSALMDLEVRLALAEAEAKALAESEARVDLEARLARETARVVARGYRRRTRRKGSLRRLRRRRHPRASGTIRTRTRKRRQGAQIGADGSRGAPPRPRGG